MRRVQMTVGLAVIVVCALVFVGCRSMTGRSVGQQFDDKVISTQVKTKLTTDRAANLFSTGVGTQFGIVRLTGTVQTPEDYSELGTLLIVQLLLSLILPFVAILFARVTRFKSA